MTSPVNLPEESAPGDCRFAEIVQYTCEIETKRGRRQMNCFPIPRIFKLCSGRPAVEITRLVKLDIDTGEVIIPADHSKLKVKKWRDVKTYDVKTQESNSKP